MIFVISLIFVIIYDYSLLKIQQNLGVEIPSNKSYQLDKSIVKMMLLGRTQRSLAEALEIQPEYGL